MKLGVSSKAYNFTTTVYQKWCYRDMIKNLFLSYSWNCTDKQFTGNLAYNIINRFRTAIRMRQYMLKGLKKDFWLYIQYSNIYMNFCFFLPNFFSQGFNGQKSKTLNRTNNSASTVTTSSDLNGPLHFNSVVL